jgi:adenine-specific DNA-methyltransferase
MIKYLGSKRALLDPIKAAVARVLPEGGMVCDLFSGSARVGHALKGQGYRVWSNDHNTYAHTLATAYVQADRGVWADRASAVIAELSEVKPEAGWFTQTFCEDARFFHPDNGARIDAMRDRIAAMALEPELEAIALVSLMEAADRVDSTAGVHMAYMKAWAPRALKPLALRMPDRAGRRRAMRWTSRGRSRPTSSIWIRRTTSIPTSGTITAGKVWCCGTGPRPTESPTSGWTSAPARAPSIRSPA